MARSIVYFARRQRNFPLVRSLSLQVSLVRISVRRRLTATVGILNIWVHQLLWWVKIVRPSRRWRLSFLLYVAWALWPSIAENAASKPSHFAFEAEGLVCGRLRHA